MSAAECKGDGSVQSASAPDPSLATDDSAQLAETCVNDVSSERSMRSRSESDSGGSSDGSASYSESESEDAVDSVEAVEHESDQYDVEAGQKHQPLAHHQTPKHRALRSRERSAATSRPSNWKGMSTSMCRQTHKKLRHLSTRKAKRLVFASVIFMLLYFWNSVFQSSGPMSNMHASLERAVIEGPSATRGGRTGHAQAGMMLVQMAQGLHEQVLVECRDHHHVSTMSRIAEQVVALHVVRADALLKGRIRGLSKLFKSSSLVVQALEDLNVALDKDLNEIVAGVHEDLVNVLGELERN
jgi:hypothetical protein